MSDDGALALVIIALQGNPFSPWYARARREGTATSPLAFSSMNVAVHGPRARSWALCERAIDARDRSADGLQIGRSTIRWRGDDLVIDLDEPTAPFPGRVQGQVIVRGACTGRSFQLDRRADHAWYPVMPCARAEVRLTSPGVSFRGSAYHDANWGAVPLDESFESWTWSRTPLRDRTLIAYDVEERGKAATGGGTIAITHQGEVAVEEPAPWAKLPRTMWGLPRRARGERARVVRTLEDTPFYSRALVEQSFGGEAAVGMHEALRLDRVRARWVERLLGYRMSRERPRLVLAHT